MIAHTARSNMLMAVLFLDLDRFKTINDTFGHQIGDLLLKTVAERLQSVVRTSDTIARLGGDEFTVILTNIAHVRDIERIAQNILNLFAQPFSLDGHQIITSTSIGISIYPFTDIEANELVKQADTAMYFAKKMGKNNYQFYSAEMDDHSTESLPPKQ